MVKIVLYDKYVPVRVFNNMFELSEWSNENVREEDKFFLEFRKVNWAGAQICILIINFLKLFKNGRKHF